MFEEAFFGFVQQQIDCAPDAGARCEDTVCSIFQAPVHPGIWFLIGKAKLSLQGGITSLECTVQCQEAAFSGYV